MDIRCRAGSLRRRLLHFLLQSTSCNLWSFFRPFNALAKIYTDGNDNPEQFLKENNV